MVSITKLNKGTGKQRDTEIVKLQGILFPQFGLWISLKELSWQDALLESM